MPTIVKCPTCGAAVKWKKENFFRPFCSERCKLIDLGAWANEERAIAGHPECGDLMPDDSKNRQE